MSDFCCRTFPVAGPLDLADLYGALCSAIPPQYAFGQGFGGNCLRFLLEGGVRAELRFDAGRCQVWLLRCPAGQRQAYADTYGPLFEELVGRRTFPKEDPHA